METQRLKKEICFLLLVLVLAIILRAIRLKETPPGFFCDEAERGVSAYSLLITGKDWHGERWPIFFKAFGEYVGPIQTYSMIPFIVLFGRNEIGVRMTSVFWSILGILGIYLLLEKIIPGWGKVGALFLAVLPWSIHYSRYGIEVMAYLTFFIFAVWATISVKENKKMIILSTFFWALFVFTYVPAKFLGPIFLLGSLVYFFNVQKSLSLTLIAGLLYLTLTAPLFAHLSTPAGIERLAQTMNKYEELPLSASLISFLERYFYQFSPKFFINGEKTFITRHFIGGLRPVYFTLFFLGVIGLMYLIIQKKIQKFLWLILFYPLAGAVPTDGGPTTTRSIIGIPLVIILAVFGLLFLFQLFKTSLGRKLLFGVVGVSLAFETIYFLYWYFYFYPLYASDFWGWQWGPREILKIFKENAGHYQKFVMSREFNEGEIFF